MVSPAAGGAAAGTKLPHNSPSFTIESPLARPHSFASLRPLARTKRFPGWRFHKGLTPPTSELVTTDTDRYQDRWKLFLPAPRSFLNPPGPLGKAKNLSFRARTFEETIKGNLYMPYFDEESEFSGPRK